MIRRWSFLAPSRARPLLLLLVALAAAACTFNPHGLGDAGYDAGRPSGGGRGGVAGTGLTGAGGGRGGAPPADGGAAGAHPGSSGAGGALPADARIAIDSDAPCVVGLAALPCAPEGLACSQDDPAECHVVRCSCVAGAWACSVTPYSCGDPCPPSGSATCGAACTGGATSCLCRRGAGSDFAGCACRSNSWQCP